MSADPFDMVRNMAPDTSTPDGTSAPDPFDVVRKMPATKAAAPVEKAAPEVADTWGNAFKGVAQAAGAIGSGTLRAVSSAANDLLPEYGFLGGPGSRAALEKGIQHDPILNYQGGPEAQPILKALQAITTPIAKIGGAVHQAISDVTSPRTADVVGDLATLAPAARGWLGESGRAGEIAGGHPLSEEAEAESARLGGFKTRGENLGLDLPEGGTPERHAAAAVNNRPVVNSAVRTELNLPANAPLSPPMLDAARTKYTTPAYQAVRDVPEIPLGTNYQAAIGEVDNLDSIAEKYRPPTGPGVISGDKAVDLSRYLRNKANKYFAAAKGNPAYEDVAQAHWDSAQAVEDAVKEALPPEKAQAWDNARIYAAKTYSVQNALDGAGNVKVTDLKRQLLKGKPLSGDLETLANLGAQYPEAFKTSRVTMPQVGIVRKVAAHAAPVAGAAVGGWLGGGLGGAAGTAAGQQLGGVILNK